MGKTKQKLSIWLFVSVIILGLWLLRSNEHTDELYEVFYEAGLEEMDVGDMIGALTSFQMAIRRKPEYAEAWYKFGTCCYCLDCFDDAVAAFNHALSLKSEYAKAHIGLGDSYKALGEYGKAAEAYERALQVDANNAITHYSLATSYRKLGRDSEAQKAYVRANQINPKAVAFLDQCTKNKADKFLTTGNDSYQSQMNEAAWTEVEYTTVAAQMRNNENAETLSQAGKEKMARGDLVGALDNFHRATQQNPRHAEAWHNLGVCYYDLDASDYAFRSFVRAIKIEPDYAEAHIGLGNSCVALSLYVKAATSYEQALKFKSDDAMVWYRLSKVYHELDRFVEAKKAYEKARRISPELVEGMDVVKQILIKNFEN